MRLDPAQLPPGYASEAINMRFRNGIAETRLGSIVIPWLNKITAGEVQPWSVIYGAGAFRDPTTAAEYVLIAAEGNVYACQPNNPPRLLGLPSGVTVVTECRFQQAFDRVLLLRGYEDDPLEMRDITIGFVEIERNPVGTGTEPIPPALRSVHAANRVFLATDDDTLLASDILDYTNYSLLNNFRINQGSDDRMVQVEMFGPGTIVALKQRSIYRVDNVYGDLTAASLTRVTARYGCVAPESVVDCGGDLVWLSQEGVASLTLTSQNEIQAAQGTGPGRARMFSEPIQPLIERIQWRAAANAVGALWNDRYYLALPVDQAEMFGDEMIRGGSKTQTISVTAGNTYLFTVGTEGDSIVNGTETVDTSRQFVAQGSSVTLATSYFYTTDAMTASSLKRVYKNVNNVVAVYDFQNGEWSGYDQADGIAVKKFIKARYNGRERLFAATHDGYVRLYEEAYADRLSQPYVDLEVASLPAVGNTVEVNAGTTVTVTSSSGDTATTWGCDTLANARSNLWRETYSFRESAVSGWTSPNCRALPLPESAQAFAQVTGVRFTATNGVLPSILTTGTWATITEVVEQDIETTFVTRAYASPDGNWSKFTAAYVDVQTWAPNMTLEVLTDGVNEVETLVSGSTRDRTKYLRQDMANYDATNANNDFYAAYREDYSIQPTSSSYEFTPGDDVYGHLHQESRLQQSANALGRSARVKLTNSTGRVRVMAAAVAMRENPVNAGVMG